MTAQEILTNAIERAIAGGFMWKGDGLKSLKSFNGYWIVINLIAVTSVYNEQRDIDETVNITVSEPFERIIFNHDFAKALWGERDYKRLPNGEPYELVKGWKDHLQQMVIAEDRIKYLGENI